MNNKVDVKYDSDSDNIILRVFFKSKNESPYVLKVTNESELLLHQQTIDILNKDHINTDFHFYFVIPNNHYKLKINIQEGNSVIYEEEILLRNKYGTLIKDPTVLIFADHLGLGDFLWANTSIKKLCKSFSKRVNVITRYPQLLVNNPYVNKVETIDKNLENRSVILEKYKNNDNFYEIFPYCTNEWGVIDLRETAAFNCGFHLLPNERQIEFFPNSYQRINELPEKYVLLNPRIAGPDRDLGREKWQRLVDILNQNGVNVVLMGVKNNKGDAEYHQLELKLGVNLCGSECQSNLSQTWHLINQSNCFVTFDTGMYILSGTTDAQIFMIGWYAEPHWHKPFRNGSYDYKLKIIEGDCKEKCLGNLKYYVNENSSLTQIKVQKCALNYSEFKCIPSVEKIATEIVEYYKNS